jgi:uracil-DNA glycosylase
MDFETPDCARSLRSKDAIVARKAMLRAHHIAPLADFVAMLRANHPEWEFPDFDPLDGGTAAEILFLFEKPGPKTSTHGEGSGFISRNNDDPSAAATFDFMIQAKLPRTHTVSWNIVPGWNGTRKVTAAELRAGVAALERLLPLLPKLHTIVFVGKKAERALPLVEAWDLNVLVSAHPSPIVRASRPDIWKSIPLVWGQARISPTK